MKQVEIKKLDELHQCILELTCISYLQNVIQYENYSILDDTNEIWEEAKNYLVDRELETISKIRNLTQSPDFAFTVK